MLLVRGGSTTLDMISGERIGRKEIYGSDVPPWVESHIGNLLPINSNMKIAMMFA